MKKITVVTGTRADFGLLTPLLHLIKASSNLELSIIATGSHLSKKFGHTIDEIKMAGFNVSKTIDIQANGGGPKEILNSVSLALNGFYAAYNDLKPDSIVILGDRYEIFAAAQAAMFMNIPICHIHGGEVTEGAYDDSIRHSISKMANLHFTAAGEFSKRLEQLGENPEDVFTTGALGVDGILNMSLMTKEEIEESLPGFEFKSPSFLVTHHPVTRAKEDGVGELDELFKSLDEFPDASILITYPNTDTSGDIFLEKTKMFADKRSNVRLVSSLGHKRYISTLEYVDVVIGNSSSGLIEVPYFAKPTVNIGDRQKGRLRGHTVIDVDANSKAITSAIKKALDINFRSSLTKNENVYGSGTSAKSIMDILEKINLTKSRQKKFFDRDLL